MLIKSKKNEEDPYIVLLNITRRMNLLSPVEQLIGRKTRRILPHHNKDIYSKVQNDINNGADINQWTDLKPLYIGHIVRIQILQIEDAIWKEWKVIEKLSSVSYLIKNNGGRTVRRNRSHIKPSTSGNTSHYRQIKEHATVSLYIHINTEFNYIIKRSTL